MSKEKLSFCDELIATFGQDVTLKFLAKFGGRTIYLPSLIGFAEVTHVVTQIKRWHKEGHSVRNVAHLSRLSVDTVIDILEDQLTHHVKCNRDTYKEQ